MIEYTNYIREVSKGKISQRLKKYAMNKMSVNSFKECVIFGIRGVQFKNDTQYLINKNEINKFNDSVILIHDEKEPRFFDATLDPGLPWIKNPMSILGCARLQEGKYSYKIGKHKGITALVQNSKVTVIRDKNKNGVWEKDEPSETGYFGINIHPRFSSGDVGNNSAGCTVIDSLPEQRSWKEFMECITLCLQDKFAYIVLDQNTAVEILNG